MLLLTSVPDTKVDWRLTNALDRIRNGGSTHFTCFTGTKVQILTLKNALDRIQNGGSTQVTCFTGTKVQKLTLRAADFGTPWNFEGLLESLRPENDLFLVGPDFGSYLEAQVT